MRETPDAAGLGPAGGDPGEVRPVVAGADRPAPPAGVLDSSGATIALAPPAPARAGIASTAGLVTGRDADGRLEVFGVDRQGGLIHSWQLDPNGVWSPWQWMGVFVKDHPSVGIAPDGRMELFALDLAGGVIHAWQLTPNGVWSGWQWRGAFAEDVPSVGTAPDGRLELFAPDRSGGLIHAWQLTPNGVWSGWQWMGAVVAGSPSIAVAPDGRLETFAVMFDDLVIHAWQLTPNGVWSAWAHMDATGRSSPSVGTAPDGRLEVFTVDRSGALLHTWQFEPGGPFGPWVWGETNAPDPPTVATAPDGRLELFAIDPNGGLIHRWQLTPNGRWSDWHWMGISAREAPAVGLAPDKRLELFVVDPSGGVLHSWQLTPNGVWSSWAWMGAFVAGGNESGYGVATVTRPLVDAARARTLTTTVYYPTVGQGDGSIGPAPGPFPLLVFAHGLNVSAATYGSLLTDLARRGYVVAAPDFPLSSTRYPGVRQSDTVAQAADVSFVVSQVEQGYAIVDRSRIGVVGHSDGGITAAGVAFNTSARDSRVGAAVVLTGAATDFPGEWFPAAGAPPALFVHGSTDGVNAYAHSTSMFARAHSPKYFLRLEGGTHLAPFVQAPFEPLVAAVIADFFDLHLAGRPNAQARLAGDGLEGGLTLTAG